MRTMDITEKLLIEDRDYGGSRQGGKTLLCKKLLEEAISQLKDQSGKPITVECPIYILPPPPNGYKWMPVEGEPNTFQAVLM